MGTEIVSFPEMLNGCSQILGVQQSHEIELCQTPHCCIQVGQLQQLALSHQILPKLGLVPQSWEIQQVCFCLLQSCQGQIPSWTNAMAEISYTVPKFVHSVHRHLVGLPHSQWGVLWCHNHELVELESSHPCLEVIYFLSFHCLREF